MVQFLVGSRWHVARPELLKVKILEVKTLDKTVSIAINMRMPQYFMITPALLLRTVVDQCNIGVNMMQPATRIGYIPSKSKSAKSVAGCFLMALFASQSE